ncbi:hypothetical protein NVP1181O_28 [Vibrio phage 1.181.O._10N.286.46.C9]|nr:hypothetical protein NVP1181O_28 [Vibrio phage 1.181.O._10N.286.46.C9]
MEIPVHNLIDISEHLKEESRKYRDGLVGRIHIEGDIKFHIHEYDAPTVSRDLPNKISVSRYKVGRVTLKNGEPVFVIEE